MFDNMRRISNNNRKERIEHKVQGSELQNEKKNIVRSVLDKGSVNLTDTVTSIKSILPSYRN